MKQKLLRIEDVKIDKEIYPRTMVDWITVLRYKDSLKAGANFPPIIVAKYKGRLICVDGFHRMEAYRQNKEKYIEVEILKNLNKKQIYIEAIKRNIGHGRQFSMQERTKIIITLEKWKMSQQQISKIVRIPAKSLQPFIAKRMTRITDTNEMIPLKAPLQNLAGVELEEEPTGNYLASRNQLQILNSLILLLENNWIDVNSEVIQEKLQRIFTLITKYL